MQLITVEGWSRESYEDALLEAMKKAAEVLSRLRNAHVSIQKMEEVEERGYHAILRVETEVRGIHHDLNMMDQFKEMSHAHDLNFRIMQRAEHDRLQHVIADHFAKVRMGWSAKTLPDFILVPMTDVNIDNQEIERKRRSHSEDPDPQ